MFALLVEVDNREEDRESRFRGPREELAPAMKLAPGFVSGVFASNEAAGNGLMLVVFETAEHATAMAGRIEIGSHPRPGVTVTRVEVLEVAATA